jgi:hypothetical protein
MSAGARHRFEESCFDAVGTLLAEGSALRAEMEAQGERTLQSLSLERGDGDAMIVAKVTERDGSESTERYSVWNYDGPIADPSDPRAAQQIALSIATGISNL